MLTVLFTLATLPTFAQLTARPRTEASEPVTDVRVVHLREAVSTALEHQPTLRKARADTEVARSRTSGAEAGLFPQLTLNGAYQRVRTTSIGARTGIGGGTGAAGTLNVQSASGVNVFSLGASASMVVWDFGQNYNRFRAARTLANALEATERTAAQGVVSDVRRAYFTARAQRALTTVAEENLANIQRHFEQIRASVAVGTRPEIDLAQARTDIANGRVQLIQAENAYAVAKAELARAMGISDAEPFEVADDELPPVPGEDTSAEHLLGSALGNRPELVALDRQRESQELTVKAARGGFGPTLTASANASKVGTDIQALGTAWSVGAQVSWPIFQGGVTRAAVREAEANVSATEAELDAQKLQIRVDLEQALVTLRASKAAALATEDARASANEQLRLAEGRYASGIGNAIELGDAQVAATTAAAQVVQAKFNVSAARADLLTALGQR